MVKPRTVLLAALPLLAGCDQGKAVLKAKTAALQAEADTLRVGRYQVVNGTPSQPRYIMLLDTETGRTWILCSDKAATPATAPSWCPMAYEKGGVKVRTPSAAGMFDDLIPRKKPDHE